MGQKVGERESREESCPRVRILPVQATAFPPGRFRVADRPQVVIENA